MLANLKIENVAVIEQVELELDGGFIVLTGETGAGKSIIIDSINAILGERTSKELVRTGTDKARVEALFYDLPLEVNAYLKENDIDLEEDGSLLIQRTVSADGRSLCRVNGRTVTVSALRQLGSRLVNIHGQHDSQALLDSDRHCAFVDMVAENGEIYQDYLTEHKKLTATRKKLESLSIDEAEKNRRLEFLRYQIEELEGADLVVGEKQELLADKKRYQDSEKIQRLLHRAHDSLEGSEDTEGASSLLDSACDTLDTLSHYYEDLSELAEKIRELLYTLEDCSYRVSGLIDDFEYNTVDINAVESRLDTLYRLSRKYGSDEEEMLQCLESLKQEYESIEASDEEMARLSELLSKTEAAVMRKGEALSDTRRAAASLLCESVGQHLKQLDMPSVVFTVEQKRTEPTAEGIDKIQFLISPNPGEAPKPLSRIASGGELSRIMLAFKSVISGRDGVNTMIFDEIDTGVSGSAAGKMAKKLRSLSGDGRQVICVTHLAKLASYADSHFYISKSTDGKTTKTTVVPLSHEQRVREIARMIGGETLTQAAMENAAEMLRLSGQ